MNSVAKSKICYKINKKNGIMLHYLYNFCIFALSEEIFYKNEDIYKQTDTRTRCLHDRK